MTTGEWASGSGRNDGRDTTHPVLELRGVRKVYGKTIVIPGLDLSVRPGESLAIIGPNGAGKSTLFNLISGRATPDGGEIVLQGRRIDGLAPHQVRRRGLSRSFQVSQLFANLSVFDNLRCALLWSLGYRYVFWRVLSGLRDVDQHATSLMDSIGLAKRRDEPARQLSYAEQRALEFGLTVAGGADVILLDEPTAGMSRSETRHFTGLIRAMTRGKTLLTVEHDMDVVFALADRVAVLVHGELLALGTPEAVRADPRVQQAYLGGELPLSAAPQGAPC